MRNPKALPFFLSQLAPFPTSYSLRINTLAAPPNCPLSQRVSSLSLFGSTLSLRVIVLSLRVASLSSLITCLDRSFSGPRLEFPSNYGPIHPSETPPYCRGASAARAALPAAYYLHWLTTLPTPLQDLQSRCPTFYLSLPFRPLYAPSLQLS
jgi:hypothetical protein